MTHTVIILPAVNIQERNSVTTEEKGGSSILSATKNLRSKQKKKPTGSGILSDKRNLRSDQKRKPAGSGILSNKKNLRRRSGSEILSGKKNDQPTHHGGNGQGGITRSSDEGESIL
jgi:hypothetical protein